VSQALQLKQSAELGVCTAPPTVAIVHLSQVTQFEGAVVLGMWLLWRVAVLPQFGAVQVRLAVQSAP
jgi:hypothetical protein